AEISADGNTIYFVDAYFGNTGQPQSAILTDAVRSGNGFTRVKEHNRLFANVNSDWLQYAMALSADELELFFTRVRRIESSARPAIFRSVRARPTEPFS